ncbi:hypothetical protein EUGRSUZ_F00431 [Eucalyptus grandis]|uniref:Uncharacterized protein n=2 Tax=Eucalyptus grandis TaxID=71139 RepID=A0ACC3KAQ3_EUCGR|nr:hypothetical protein EUGRSUZ_F00431 [Eucalyptus grandis]
MILVASYACTRLSWVIGELDKNYYFGKFFFCLMSRNKDLPSLWLFFGLIWIEQTESLYWRGDTSFCNY